MKTPTLYALETNVPVPEPNTGGRPPGPLSKTMQRMKVGESFVYPETKQKEVYLKARRFKIKVVTRIESGDLRRCWRTK